jgi:predicted nucleotidyltransferase
MTQFLNLLKRLDDHGVEFVVIGGVAAILLGSPTSTLDVDVCAPMTDENLDRIHTAMQGLNARFRFRPDKMRFFEDPARIHGFKNLNLDTDWGTIDILGELPGICTYDELRLRVVGMDIEGFRCRVVNLDTLIAAKEHAGRQKDKFALAHLKAIRAVREAGNAPLFKDQVKKPGT